MRDDDACEDAREHHDRDVGAFHGVKYPTVARGSCAPRLDCPRCRKSPAPAPRRSRTSVRSSTAPRRGSRRRGCITGTARTIARDDAAALVFHALGLAHESAPASYRLPVSARDAARVDALVERRIRERLPSAYLTGVSWFAGHEIRVTPDVLVPRSPIAELCLAGFAPWIDPARVRRVLDIGTGSGCIAIAAAHALPRARVDATDVSAARPGGRPRQREASPPRAPRARGRRRRL